ncbi:sphingomyelin phosphodiesterase [Folsomia candida]|uniref:sphingomyelin phosphodiesterase n=1 Tax=Folsomia candida TaxID=158441 RepID=UPI000B902862|nr:sphingomyelin phosphodiesterase [Folsomia candida]
MRLSVGIWVVLLVAIGVVVTDAKMSEEQIKIVRKLPVKLEYQDNLIQHYDEVRSWVVSHTLSAPTPARASVPCFACRVLMNVVIELLRASEDIGGIVAILKLLACEALDVIDALHKDVCTGAIDMYAENLHYIVDNNPKLKAIDVCLVLLGKSGEDCDGERTEEFYNWVIRIKGDKPAILNPDPVPANTVPVKVLQLTDIHLDLDYVAGKDTKCGKPMCCQAWEADGVDDASSAGPHGDFKCDMPISAMNELFEYSAAIEGYDYDFVMMTGDIPPHNVWNTTLLGNLEHFKSTNDKLLRLFPTDRSIPVYPVLGNHEPHPCNLYPPRSVWDVSDFDKSWMYNAFAEAYADQIKDPVAIEQFRQTGYYTIKHKDTNLRIVVINTNFGYTMNFWLLYKLDDPEGQLQWLSDTLEAAEVSNEKVFILGHMPPGSGSCWGTWSAQFERIILRYEAIIMAQFYGHTHNDAVQIFYDSSARPARPANSLYIGASTTAHTNLNPGFKVYHVDGGRGADSTWEIMDHETWIYNLTEANANVEPNGAMPWKLMYKAKETFNMGSFRPKDLDDLAYRMLFNEDLFANYHRFYHKDSDVRGSCTSSSCRLDYICDMVIANTNDYKHCDRFRAYFLIGETTTATQPTGGSETTAETTSETTESTTESTTAGSVTTSSRLIQLLITAVFVISQV